MRAADAKIERDALPPMVFASDKHDGCRLIKFNGEGYSRAMTPIRNRELALFVRSLPYDNFEAEFIILDDHGKPLPFDVISGTFRSFHKPLNNFRLMAFDTIHFTNPTSHRIFNLRNALALYPSDHVTMVNHTTVHGKTALIDFYADSLKRGMEGIVIRDPFSIYKQGTSTLSGAELLRIKPFLDDEATIVGFEELKHNENLATTNEVGLTERSTHSENLRPGGVLGAFIVSWKGLTFRVGTGLTAEQRERFWRERNTLLTRTLTFKYNPTHMTDRPTSAVFKCIR